MEKAEQRDLRVQEGTEALPYGTDGTKKANGIRAAFASGTGNPSPTALIGERAVDVRLQR